jgi:hypothetical protein
LRDSQIACTPQDLLAEFDLRKLSVSAMRGDDHELL